MKKIAIIFGGQSSEYEISLESSHSVLNAIDNNKYEIYKIGITQDGKWLLYNGDIENIKNNTWLDDNVSELIPILGDNTGFLIFDTGEILKLDLVFPVMHGEYVEDGKIQGLFEMMGLPYIGCGVLSSSIGFHKAITQKIVHSIGINIAKNYQLNKHNINGEELNNFINEVNYPIFVKPLRAGSSKGISKVESDSELNTALYEAFKYDETITIEEAIEGFEVGCGVLEYDNKLIIGSVDEIELSHGFFDYTEKYNLITSKIHMPARISDNIKSKIQELTERIFILLECKGLARIDFFINNDEEIIFNEINTLPGFTNHSRYPSMLNYIGISYDELIDKLLENELMRNEK